MKPSISKGPVPYSRCRSSSARNTVSRQLTFGRSNVSTVDASASEIVAGVSAVTSGGPGVPVPGLSLSERVAALLRRRGIALPKKNWS